MSIFQYQAVAEPVLVPAVAATVFLDWYVQPHFVPRQRLRPQIDAITEPFSVGITVFNPAIGSALFSPAIVVRARQTRAYLPDQIVEPVIASITAGPHVVVTWKVAHDERAEHSQSRVHEQQVSDIFNNLLNTGQLRGTTAKPMLGYNSLNIQNWKDQRPPLTQQEANERFAAALAALGQKP